MEGQFSTSGPMPTSEICWQLDSDSVRSSINFKPYFNVTSVILLHPFSFNIWRPLIFWTLDPWKSLSSIIFCSYARKTAFLRFASLTISSSALLRREILREVLHSRSARDVDELGWKFWSGRLVDCFDCSFSILIPVRAASVS